MPEGSLADLVAAELVQPVDERIGAFAAVIAARHGGAEAVLFYGSCLYGPLDGAMLDFYLIVADYRQAYTSPLLARLNRWLPPNVFPVTSAGLRAKYAVLDRSDFARLCSSQTANPAVWARFAQPSRLVWVADEAARDATVAAVAQAAPALMTAASPLLAGKTSAIGLWDAALAATYATELRAEPPGRGRAAIARDPQRYQLLTGPALAAANIVARRDGDSFILPAGDNARARTDWARRRRHGKLLSALRLLKASLTYDGGLDYLAWKIERHTGVAVRLHNWHRRWPAIGGMTLLPRLLWRGAVR